MLVKVKPKKSEESYTAEEWQEAKSVATGEREHYLAKLKTAGQKRDKLQHELDRAEHEVHHLEKLLIHIDKFLSKQPEIIKEK